MDTAHGEGGEGRGRGGEGGRGGGGEGGRGGGGDVQKKEVIRTWHKKTTKFYKIT